MTPLDFLPYLVEGLSVYFLIGILVLVFYFPFLRLSFNIFDPFFLIMVGGYFSTVLVLFLKHQDLISEKYFTSFIITELSFLLGVSLFSGKLIAIFEYRSRVNLIERESLSKIKSILLVSTAFYFLTTILDYYLNGVPVLRISRLGAYVGSGGFGVFERFNDVSLSLLSISLLAIILTKRDFVNRSIWRFFSITILILLLITFVLSGSKSIALILGFAWFYLTVFWFSGRYCFRVPSFTLNTKGKFFLFLGFIFSIVTIYIQSSNGGALEMVYHLAFRFVNYGDVFLYAYINDNIERINGDNPFIGLFGGFLSIFRVISSNDIYTPIGIQLPRIVQPELDYLTGPNARHNVAGLHYFGEYFSWIYSLILGLLVSFVRFRLFRYMRSDFFSFCLLFVLTKALITIHVDFEFSMSKLASVIIVYPIVLLLSRSIVKRNG